MTQPLFDIPILFLMFNRPNHASLVFKQIKIIRPSKLFISVDGARLNHPEDVEKIKSCIQLVNLIDWPCEIHTLFRSENLGCGQAVSTAIDWFFENVEMGIILEDDCLPNYSFFNFCRENLIKYQTQTSIMHIGGVNYYNQNYIERKSYSFTKICHVWGWATWRRAWKKYDFDMKTYEEFVKNNSIKNIFSEKEYQTYWLKAFNKIYSKAIDTWDYQWVYTVWTNSGLAILPNQNLVSNIGFDEDATHTKNVDDELFNKLKITSPIDNLFHPTFILENKELTQFALKKYFREKGFIENKIDKIKQKIKQKNWKL